MEKTPVSLRDLAEHATEESRPHAGQRTNGFRGDTSKRTSWLVLIVEPLLVVSERAVSSSLDEALTDCCAIALSRFATLEFPAVAVDEFRGLILQHVVASWETDPFLQRPGT
jgi:hypothetical protein